MKTCLNLPEHYVPILEVDLQKNKKLAIIVNVAAILIGIVMIAAAIPFVPMTALFDLSQGMGAYLLRFLVLIVGTVGYIYGHELVHGICMKHYSNVRPHYGFAGIYAYAGSDAYFDKKSYIIIALAPVILWGVVFAVILPFVPKAWFWVVYFLEVFNISGAAGDLYVTCKFLGLPADILVKDIGVSMMVYAAEKK